MRLETMLKVVEKYDCNYGYGVYADDTETQVVVADWNNEKLETVMANIERHYPATVLHYDDEVTTCSECGNIISTIPGYYGDIPQFYCSEEGPICAKCAEGDDYQEYIQWILDDSSKANTLMNENDLDTNGFENMNGMFENGFHHGQNDNPASILTEYQDKFPHHEFIFHIDHCGQFDTHFQIYGREF